MNWDHVTVEEGINTLPNLAIVLARKSWRKRHREFVETQKVKFTLATVSITGSVCSIFGSPD